MASDILKGQWKQLSGQIKERWGELTDDEIVQLEGRRDRLIGKLQEKYGYSKQEAEDRVNSFMREMGE